MDSLPDPKALRKLAETCRKAGIKHFKSPSFEFTLTDDAPASYTKVNKTKQIGPDLPFMSDTPSEEELLLWSTGGGMEIDMNGNTKE